MPIRRLALIGLVAFFAAGCIPEPGRGEVSAGQGERLIIGVLVEQSGPLADTGRAVANAIELAIASAAETLRQPVEARVVEGGCEPTAARAAAASLAAEERLLGVIGPLCSPACLAVQRPLFDRGIPLLTPRCTDVVVTRQGHDGVFRLAWSDAIQAAAAADFASDYLLTERVFVVHDGTLYGKALRDVFEFVFGKSNLAGKVEAPPETADYGPLARSIARSDAGMVYYTGGPAAVNAFVQALRAAGVTLPVVMPDASLDRATLAAAGGALDGVRVTEPVPLRDRPYDAFAAAYRDRFGLEPGPFAAEAYDAVTALLKATAKVADQRAGRLVIDRQELIDRLYRSDFVGPSGRIRFRPNGDRRGGAVVRLSRVQAGALVEERILGLD